MRKVLFVADDFGMLDGVCRGIIRAADTGVVRHASALMCQPGSAERVRRFAAEFPGTIGLHLQITDGVPVSPPEEVSSLLADGRSFPRSWRHLGSPDPGETLTEWRRQFQKLIACGITPVAIDAHHNIHRLPQIAAAYFAFAREVNLPARTADAQMTLELRRRNIVCADLAELSWSVANPTLESLEQRLTAILESVPEGGVLEVDCHPAEVDDELRKRSNYVESRARELEILTAPECEQLLGRLGLEIATVTDLSARPPDTRRLFGPAE